MKDREDPVTEWHQRLQAAARKALTEDDVREVVQAIVADAKRGDRRARELVLKFLQLDQQPAPATNSPAQQIKAHTVNVYAAGRRRKQPKLLIDVDSEREAK